MRLFLHILAALVLFVSLAQAQNVDSAYTHPIKRQVGMRLTVTPFVLTPADSVQLERLVSGADPGVVVSFDARPDVTSTRTSRVETHTAADTVYYEQSPVLQHMPEISYPREALRRRIAGTVIIQGLVGKDGRVHETRITQSVPLFDREAVRIMRKSRWEPARDEKGNPVAVWVEIPVKFTPTP